MPPRPLQGACSQHGLGTIHRNMICDPPVSPVRGDAGPGTRGLGCGYKVSRPCASLDALPPVWRRAGVKGLAGAFEAI